MISITIDIRYYPVYEAYSHNRGLLFFLLRGGWRKTYIDKDGKEKAVYKIWAGDKEFLRLMCAELPF